MRLAEQHPLRTDGLHPEPTLLIKAASHSARNTGCRNGVQAPSLAALTPQTLPSPQT
jgi:hypothetical protein